MIPKEIREEMEREIREDAYIEYKLRTDWEYALNHLNVSEDMSVGEFAQALKKLQSYGWDITADELLESI